MGKRRVLRSLRYSRWGFQRRHQTRMDDQVLNRLHKAILQFEGGEVSATFVRDCFKYFHTEIIDAPVTNAADPDTQSDPNSITLANSLEIMNLLLKMVLILH